MLPFSNESSACASWVYWQALGKWWWQCAAVEAARGRIGSTSPSRRFFRRHRGGAAGQPPIGPRACSLREQASFLTREAQASGGVISAVMGGRGARARTIPRLRRVCTVSAWGVMCNKVYSPLTLMGKRATENLREPSYTIKMEANAYFWGH